MAMHIKIVSNNALKINEYENENVDSWIHLS